MTSKKISLKEIAELSGLSTASVSRILNKTGRYSKEAEKRVLEIVEKYGYTVNASAKALRQNHSMTIGLMIPDITNDFFSRIAYYCEQYLREAGYSLFICSSNNLPEVEAELFSKFVSNNVDGILAVSTFTQVPLAMTNANIPTVAIDRVPRNLAHIPRVLTDEYNGSYQATGHLIKKGCRNIVSIVPGSMPHKGINPEPRYKGFYDAMANNHLPLHDYSSYWIPITQDSGVETESILAALFAEHDIDGIFCGSDRIALGALNACRRNNLSVPEDVCIIGFDNSIYTQLPTPTISTVGRSPKHMTASACRLLLNIIEGNEDMKGQTIYEPIYLVERESTDRQKAEC